MDLKNCILCKEEKSIKEYRSRIKNKFHDICKRCRRNESNRLYYEKNRNIKLKYCKERYYNNKEHVLRINKNWVSKNKEKYDNAIKNWKINNQNKVKKASKDYYERNKNDKDWKEQKNRRIRERKKYDINFKIGELCKTDIYNALKRQNLKKKEKCNELLGCTIVFYKKWIEFQFNENMNWNNWGIYWEIDHVTPKASFNLKIKKERYKCFNWKNTRPLKKELNNKKKDKIIKKTIIIHAIKAYFYNKQQM